jgi:hypothetical protein
MAKKADWIDLSYNSPEKEKTKESSTKHKASWLDYSTEPIANQYENTDCEWLNDTPTPEEAHQLKEGKTDCNWLETDESGDIIAEATRPYNSSWSNDYNYLSQNDITFLKDRNLYDFVIGHTNENIQVIIKQIRYIERSKNIVVSRDKIQDSQIPIIREKAEIDELAKLSSYITEQNSIHDKSDCNIPLDFTFPHVLSFNFNHYAESQHYRIGKTIFDVETDKQSQKPIACGAYNFETNRLVIGIRNKERAGEFYKINGNTYLIYTPNLWDAVLIADIELIIAVTLTSALMEGQNELISILKRMKLPKKLSINDKYLQEFINAFPMRRSVWIAHNAQFDIDMLNWTHKKAGYKFTFLEKSLPHDTVNYYLGRPIDKIKIMKNPEIRKKTYKVNEYKMHLGNKDVGFRFRIQADRRNMRSMFKANLSPCQKDAFTFLWIVDTLALSMAMRNPKHSLKELSKDTEFPKRDFKDYNFPIEELDIVTKEKITEPVKYLIFDLFSTLAVYEKLTNGLNYLELETLLKTKYTKFKFNINWRPKTSKILSTATISKDTIINVLISITGLKRSQIENNIEHERLSQKNFEEVYSGGVNEATTWGVLISNFADEILTYYDDFQSLYPSIARIVNAFTMYVLAAQRKLNTLLRNDLEKGKSDFWKIAKEIIKITRQRIKGKDVKLPDDLFHKLIGTVEIDTQIPLQLRTLHKELRKDGKPRKSKGKRCWKLITGKNHLHLIDLLNAVVRSAVEFNQDINLLESQIKFTKLERYDFSRYPIAKWGKEFFTMLLKLRQEKKLTKDSIEDMLKYIINTAYGISGEGINKEDITGKLFIPAIFCSITAGARFLISIPEIIIKKLGGILGYMDTDSIIYKIHKSLRKRVIGFFDKISALKEETDYGIIHKAFIAKKKKYTFLSEKINEEKFPDQFLKLPNGMYVLGKIHGKMQYNKKDFSNTIFHISKDLFNEFTTKETHITDIVNRHKDKHPVLKNLKYSSKVAPIMKGILKFFYKTRTIKYTKKKEKESTTYRVKNPTLFLHSEKFDGFYIYFYFDMLENKLLITNLSEEPIRSNFGLYGNFSNNKVKILYTIPIDEKETQLKFEKRFFEFIINVLSKNNDKFFFTIRMKQAELIIDLGKTTKQFLKSEFDQAKIYLQENKMQEIYNNYLSRVSVPIAKNKWFFNLNYRHSYIKFTKEDKFWLSFANEYNDLLMSEFEGSESKKEIRSIIDRVIYDSEPTDLQMLNTLLEKIGIDKINIPSRSYLISLAREQSIPNRSKMNKKELWRYVKNIWYQRNDPSSTFEELLDKIAENKYLAPDNRIHLILDSLLGTQVFELEIFETQEYSLKNPSDREFIIGYQNFNTYFSGLKKGLINEFIHKKAVVRNLTNYFSFDKSLFLRYIKKKEKFYYVLEVEKQKRKEKNSSMLTHDILGYKYFTDGIDYRLWCKLDELDFAEELLANANQLHSQNLINFARIASYIYYKTHNKTEKIAKIFSKNPKELPCPTSNTNVHIPLRMRLLLDSSNREPSKHDIRMAFDNTEVKILISQFIIKEEKNHYYIIDTEKFDKYVEKNIIKHSYRIIGREAPTTKDSEFPTYYKEKFLNRVWSFEIVSNKSLDYNSKILINFIVRNKRTVMIDLHLNPNSQNLLNIELFKTSIKEIEANDWIVKKLFFPLFKIKELAFFTRNASITIEDMKTKSDLSYLRKTFYSAVSHMVLEDNIKTNSQVKIGFISLTGQIQIQNTTPAILFSFLNSAILEKFNEWIKKQPKKKVLKILNKEITPMPHKASKGISINHWFKGLSISLYTKDEHWYRSKISRVSHYRGIEINESLSEQIMNKVWLENTIRYEITLRGFEAIHTKEYHEILQDLEQFFLQLDELFKNNPKVTKIFQNHINKIKEILPNPVFSTIYPTPKIQIIKHSNCWIESKIDESGYSTPIGKPPPYKDEPD